MVHAMVVRFLGRMAGALAITGVLLPLASCGDGDVERIPVIAYHGITTDLEVVEGAADPRFFDVRLPAFEDQMEHLHEAGFRTITPLQYKRWVHGEDVSLPAKPILITFDDGQTSARLATPVLDRYGFVAVMYVVSGFADGAFEGPDGEPDWYLGWDQLREMRASGRWIMQFHAGPRGHAYVDDPASPDCHRLYPCRLGDDDATYRARVKSDVAQGLGAMRSVFDLPDEWHGSTFAVPWDDAAGSETTTEPWLAAYLADMFPVVFVQDSYAGDVDNQRYRFEVHNPLDLEQFTSSLDSPRFARP
jgi:Polysaccharide deacetylase